MLMMGLPLPILNDVVPEYVLYLVADFNLGSVTDQFGHSVSPSYVILEYIDKLLVCLHWVDITYHGFCAYKELCCCYSTINCRGI